MEKPYTPTDETSSIQYILYNSPYGSLGMMINDVSTLKKFDIKEECYQDAIRANLETHCEILTGKEAAVKCLAFGKGAGKNEKGHYYDNHYTKKRFYVENQEICSSEDLADDQLPQQDTVQKLGDSIKVYLEDLFGSNRDFSIIATASTIDFCYTAKTKNSSNFYNGYWLGTWSFNGENLVGRIDTRAHIFENGHVHFHEYKDSTSPIVGKDSKEKCMNMIQEIMNIENKVGLRLAEYYNTDTEIGSKVFKGLRRPLPFTKQPMDWDMSVQSVIASIRSNENN